MFSDERSSEQSSKSKRDDTSALFHPAHVYHHSNLTHHTMNPFSFSHQATHVPGGYNTTPTGYTMYPHQHVSGTHPTAHFNPSDSRFMQSQVSFNYHLS